MKNAALGGMLCLATYAVSPLAQAMSWGDAPQTDRIIVKYKETANAAALPLMVRTQIANQRAQRISAAANQQAQVVSITTNNAFVYQLDSASDIDDVESLADDIASNSDVEYAEPDYIMYPKAVPNDPSYNQQWHYYEQAGGLNLEAAWDITTGSDDVVVAIIDTGVRNHVDLRSNLLPGYDFISNASSSNDGDGRDSDASDAGDAMTAGECGGGYPPQDTPSSWHGTHVAGTVAAVGNNGIGVTGVAWNAKVLPIRVLGKCGGYTSDIVDGMRWSVGLSVTGIPNNPYPAQVLNMSLGGTAPCTNTYQYAINDVVNTGATIVVAAGNESQNASNSSPANCSNVVTVAATDRNGGLAYYSNFGSTVDVSAPGGEMSQWSSANAILSTYNSGQRYPGSDSYDYSQGTSMATPHVAGVAALMYAVNGDVSAAEVESALKESARSFPNVSGDDQCTTSQCGSGIVDAEAALIAVGGDSDDDDDSGSSEVVELENGKALSSLADSQYGLSFFKLEVPEGATNLSFVISGGSGDADIYVRAGDLPTVDTYDHRPYKNGNAETVSISEPSAGTYFVMLRGYYAYNGLSLVASYDEPVVEEPSFFENKSNVSIPDNNSSGASSVIDVTRSGYAGSISVSIDIRHTYRGDLTVKLYAPNGANATLVSTSSDSSDNVIQTYRFNAASIPAQGQWRLHAADSAWRDVGYINEWSITFE
ncbi:MAG: S8 family serine peptidase [Pseudomonadales bacterium]|nr:S8 family serine peptidase [Pseudomonadales bacterium]